MGVMSWLLGMGCDNVSPDEVREISKDKGVLLVDVRTPQEYATRNIKGSKLVPLQELGSRHGEIPKDKDIIVFCQNGIRSIMACKMLKQLGYSRVRNMSGGISRW